MSTTEERISEVENRSEKIMQVLLLREKKTENAKQKKGKKTWGIKWSCSCIINRNSRKWEHTYREAGKEGALVIMEWWFFKIKGRCEISKIVLSLLQRIETNPHLDSYNDAEEHQRQRTKEGK